MQQVADVVAVDVRTWRSSRRPTASDAPGCTVLPWTFSVVPEVKEKQEQRRRVDTEVDLRRLDVMCCNPVRVRRVVDQDETIFGQPEVQAGKLLVACFVGDDQLAVDVPDLSLEFSSTPGRIDADDRGPGQGRAARARTGTPDRSREELRCETVRAREGDFASEPRAALSRTTSSPAPVLRPRPQTQVLITRDGRSTSARRPRAEELQELHSKMLRWRCSSSCPVS